MGLDTSHDCWHGPYSAFTRFRNDLARAAGYVVWPVKFAHGMTDTVMLDTVMLDWGHVPEGALYGEWTTPPSDPLLALIIHSDCEGVIHPREATLLADRMEGLMPLLTDDPIVPVLGPRERCRKFIDGLRKAVANNEDVDFH